MPSATWNRYRITGTLTTRSPLHIGAGTTTRDGLSRKEGHGEKPLIAAVCTDHRGRAYLPGSTLKGNLRAWLSRSAAAGNLAEAEIKALFGGDKGSNSDPGGRAEVWDALIKEQPQEPPHARYWSDQRCTEVTASVALARDTRTASEAHLFHQEVVFAGVPFQVGIGAEGLTDPELLTLLAALEAFNLDDDPVTLGAGTADGWGRMEWRLDTICRAGDAEVQQWIEDGCPSVGWAIAQAILATEQDAHQVAARKQVHALRPPSTKLCLHLRLPFDAHFLVNDPSQTGKGEGEVDHYPLLGEKGHPLLPSASLRGVLRSRTEYILRTLAGPGGGACHPDDPVRACPAIHEVEEVANLCPACKLFGGPGWTTAIGCSDLRPEGAGTAGTEVSQQLHAEDRFTGGVSGSCKYDITSFLTPTLGGTLSIDLDRLDRAGALPWALLLIAHLLRDLTEGDLTFGMKGGRGYGACLGEVTVASLPEQIPDRLRGLLGESPEERLTEVVNAILDPVNTSDGARHIVSDWQDPLQQAATKYRIPTTSLSRGQHA